MHLIPSDSEEEQQEGGNSAAVNQDGEGAGPMINVNVFRNLDSVVSEGGDNFSSGEKQLIWYVPSTPF